MAKYWRCTLNSILQGNLNKSHHLCKKKPAWLNDHDGRSWKQILETKVEWEGWIISPAECTLSCRLVDIRPCYRRQFNLSVRRRRKRPTVVSLFHVCGCDKIMNRAQRNVECTLRKSIVYPMCKWKKRTRVSVYAWRFI